MASEKRCLNELLLARNTTIRRTEERATREKKESELFQRVGAPPINQEGCLNPCLNAVARLSVPKLSAR